MNANEKRWVVLLVAVALIAIILIVVLVVNNGREEEPENTQQEEMQANEEKYAVELDNGLKVNISEDFTKPKTYGDLEISNISYTYADGMSLLLADVTNNGTTEHREEIVKLSIIGDNDEVIAEIRPTIGNVKPGETIQLNASIIVDLTNAKDFRIEPLD